MRKKIQKKEKPIDFNKICEKLFKLSGKIKILDNDIHKIIDSMVLLPVKKKNNHGY